MRHTRLLAGLVLCLLAVPAASAAAAGRTRARPSVSSVGPALVHVGGTLTIRGRNLVAGKRRTTVAFRRAGGRAVSVTAATATATRITVVVPAALARSLVVVAGVAQPTRFGVRVQGRRSSKWYMTAKRSALVAPATAGEDTLDTPADCLGDAPADTLGDVVDSLDGDVSAPVDDLLDPVGAAAEQTLCADGGGAVADDPAAPDVTDPEIDPGDPGNLDALP